MTRRLDGAAESWPVWLAVAAPVYLVSCVVGVGGLTTTKPWGDVGQYELYARKLLDGVIPYADFSIEYPPGALLVFVPPALVTDGSTAYLMAFKVLMAGFGLVALGVTAWTLDRLRAGRAQATLALALGALAPLLLGHVYLNRYDPFAAALAAAALATLLVGRAGGSGALLGVGFAAKVFAAVVVPVAAIRLRRTRGDTAVVHAATWFTAAAATIFGYFLLTGFGGVGFTFWTQAKRHLQIESVGASVLLVADQLGVRDVTIIAGAPGSIDLGGTLPDLVALLSTALAVAVVVGVWVAYWRAAECDANLVLAVVTAVVAFTVLAKVISPQYLTWLVPLVPLVAGRRGTAATVLLAVALVLTQVELQGYVGLSIEGWAVWALLVRNLVLLAVLALLLLEVRDSLAPRRQAAAAATVRDL